jgi:hypothetical protein
MRMHKLKNEQGSVFIGIMTLVSVGILMHVVFMQTYWFQTQYYLQERFNEDAQSFASQARMMLSDPMVCQSMFKDHDLTEFATVIEKGEVKMDLTDSEKYLFGTKGAPMGVKITDAGIDNTPLKGSKPGEEIHAMTYFLSPVGQIGNPRKVIVPVYFTKNGSSVLNCYSTALVDTGKKVDDGKSIEEHVCNTISGQSYNPATGECGS